MKSQTKAATLTDESESPAEFDLSAIDRASIEPSIPEGVVNIELYNHLTEMVSYLSDSLSDKDAELERLKGQQTVEQVRAGLLAPFSSKVYWFVVGYCAVVGLMLALSGWRNSSGFVLSDTVLGIIAGSTAVSVIGLIGMVISGLFGIGTRKD